MGFRFWMVALAAGLLVAPSACRRPTGYGQHDQSIVRVEGSDTMVNIAQAWAENYHRRRLDVSVQVLGGGSGVGIASLIDGNTDLANSSRDMSEAEIARARQKRGLEPHEIIVGYDALAVYVHKDNPLNEICLEQLAQLYGEHGTTIHWSQLGAPRPGRGDQIVVVGRQNSSGTYAFFRDVILGKTQDMKLGSVDQSGSKDVVALISRTPSAIGYSGMGYRAPGVKMLSVARRRGEPAVPPTVENARNGSYPLTRPLQIYVLGEPAGEVKQFLDWILSSEGQEIVLELGYIPLASHE